MHRSVVGETGENLVANQWAESQNCLQLDSTGGAAIHSSQAARNFIGRRNGGSKMLCCLAPNNSLVTCRLLLTVVGRSIAV